MQKFTIHKGLVAPMDRENVDTDAIIPKLASALTCLTHGVTSTMANLAKTPLAANPILISF
jgi:3-isopropylmalate dehydratase small subunit